MRYRSYLTIAGNSIRQALTNPRIWVVYAITVILSLYCVRTLVDNAALHGTTVHIMEGYLAANGWRNGNAILLILVAFLFCDAPFIDNSTFYTVQRSGRMDWVIGKLICIFCLTAFMQLIVALVTTLSVLPYAYVGNNYSVTLYQMVKDMQTALSWVMMRAISPTKAAVYCFLLNVLISMFTGALLFIINLRFKRIYGFCVVGALVMLDIIVAKLSLPLYLSPLSISDLYAYSYGQTLPALTLPLQGVAILATADISLYYLCSLFVGRKSFSFGE